MKTEIYKITDPEKQKNDIERVAEALKKGELAAIPTETVYGLAANAFNEDAIKKIFKAKGRPQDNPLIVHIAKIEDLYVLASAVPEKALRLAEKFWPGPLTIILPKSRRVPMSASAGLPTVAVRMPSNPVASAIIKAAGVPLAAPSANISGFPSPTEAKYVIDDMFGVIAVIVDGGESVYGIESTVITLSEEPPRLLRPGAVTYEQLKEVLGEIEIDPSVLKPLTKNAAAISPGMKYRHYSPKAKISIVRGNIEEFTAYVQEHKNEADYVLCFENEETGIPLPAVTFGRENDSLSQARRLFDALRELDEKGAKKVFARSPSAAGVGLGVCNRLYRAAGFSFLPAEKCFIIGVTGGSGSGKTTVCEIFRKYGCEIIDADIIAKRLTENNPDIIKTLINAFGEDIIRKDGSLDRKALARIAFSSEKNKEKLDRATHPQIVRECRRKAREAVKKGKNVVIDAPLLFTSGLNLICDKTARVFAPEEIRLERIIKRDGITKDEARMRFVRQLKEAEKAKSADFVINNFPPFDVEEEVRKALGS